MNTEIEKAIDFAQKAHADQLYGENQPYMHHLANAADIVEFYLDKAPNEYVQAAFLHDTLEDTDTSIDQLKEAFGDRVASLVFAVTDGEGVNRAARHAATYPKIRDCPGALLVKLADRIANIEYSILTTNHSKLGMYVKEWSEFERELNPPKNTSNEPVAIAEMKMWVYLEDLMDHAKHIIFGSDGA